jgi:hypothetical protein
LKVRFRRLWRIPFGRIIEVAELEKKARDFQNTFSALTNTLVDLYYYPDQAMIYFGKDDRGMTRTMSFLGIMKSKSNASFFDRIFTYYLFLNQKNQQQLTYTSEKFSDNYQGYFYNANFRNEKSNLQLIYSKSYATALKLSKIFEGEGIRVADISEGGASNSNRCMILQSNKDSLTAAYLANYFHCDLTNNNQRGL